MIIINVFLALLWGFFIIGVLVGGMYWAWVYALDSDKAGVKPLPAIWGVIWRVLTTICMLAAIIGVPLQLTFN